MRPDPEIRSSLREEALTRDATARSTKAQPLVNTGASAQWNGALGSPSATVCP
jgi:hypothetical protein